MEHAFKNNIIVEVRKSNFNGKCSIRIEIGKDKDGNPIYHANGRYSQPHDWKTIKAYLKKANIDTPTLKDMRFFSDGFDYSYAWFDGYGKVIGR